VIEEGMSGLIVNSIDEAVSAVDRVRAMDRERVRGCFEARFTATRMANDYVAAYQHVLSGPIWPKATTSAAA
jgi:hypothetical protein